MLEHWAGAYWKGNETMKLNMIILAAFTAVWACSPATAGNLVTTGLDDPHVIPPPQAEFSWSGPYAGLSYGQSNHARTYEREWEETEVFTEETPWEKHSYWCDRGEHKHFGFKCDITGLTDAIEFGGLSGAKNPWNTARDQTVTYNNGYDGLWMGADDRFEFTLGEYIAPADRDSRWGQVGYEYLSGVDIQEWSETTSYSEEFTVVESDTNYGAFVGYRHQFETVPFVVGAELNHIETQDHGSFTQLGLQGGLSVGRVLPYAEVGSDHYAGGVDVALGRSGNILVGARSWENHDGEDSGQHVRIGWKRSF